MADIFVSYKREDGPVIAPIVKAFEARGWSVWWDQYLKVGPTWDSALEEQVRAAKCVVVAWSQLSVQSEPVRAEAHVAREMKKLVPIMLDGTRPPLMFALAQGGDLSTWKGDLKNTEFRKVCDAIAGYVGSDPVRAARQDNLTSRKNAITNKPMLLVNTAWMRDYSGLEDDEPVGNHGHIKQGLVPHEIFNFLPTGGYCYGYAPVTNGRMNVSRLGAVDGAETADGVLVVWTATNPERGRFIVGWYEDSIAYADMQTRKVANSREKWCYSFKAPEERCRLLPPEERYFYVPTRQDSFPGMAASFFVDENARPEWNAAVRRYIAANLA